MNVSIATVIKTGNSYALRVPKAYAERNKLRPGAKVRLPDPQYSGGTLADLETNIKAARRNNEVTAWDKVAYPAEWQRVERSNWA